MLSAAVERIKRLFEPTECSACEGDDFSNVGSF